jgi:hypothetical protein
MEPGGSDLKTEIRIWTLQQKFEFGFSPRFSASILACFSPPAKTHKQRVLKPRKFGRLYTYRYKLHVMTNKKNKAKKKQAAANGSTSAGMTNGIDVYAHFYLI